MPAERFADVVTLGVEEEYQIVDPATRQLRSRSGRVLPLAREAVGDEVTGELYQSQIEVGTPVCRTLGEARDELKRLRRALVAAAARDGDRIAAAGTHPFSRWEDQDPTPRDRYFGLLAHYQQLARELVTFGCHVHVGVEDRELAIRVMNRARQDAITTEIMEIVGGAEALRAGQETESDLLPDHALNVFDLAGRHGDKNPLDHHHA